MFFRGQRVVCIDAKVRPDTPDPIALQFIHEGAIYVIADIRDKEDGTGIALEEVTALLSKWGKTVHVYYFKDRFRPLVDKKTDISVFKALLNPSDDELELVE